jgi:hypothetical protein
MHAEAEQCVLDNIALVTDIADTWLEVPKVEEYDNYKAQSTATQVRPGMGTSSDAQPVVDQPSRDALQALLRTMLWELKTRTDTITLVQKALGLKSDGVFSSATKLALQKYYMRDAKSKDTALADMHLFFEALLKAAKDTPPSDTAPSPVPGVQKAIDFAKTYLDQNFTNYRMGIYYGSPQTGPEMEKIRDRLGQLGIKMDALSDITGKGKRPDQIEVRYFTSSRDKPRAEAILRILKEEFHLNQAGISYVGNNASVPAGDTWLEIWFDSRPLPK